MNLLDFERLQEKIDGIAEYDFSSHKVFGSAYWVYQNGKTLERCYGTEGLNSNNPITASTVFRLASMTKPITSVATLILVERGLLSLDDPVDKFLPQFGDVKIKEIDGKSYAPKKIPTIKNILTHTSGIAGESKKFAAMTEADRLTLDAAIDFYLKSGLDYEPGTRAAYNGFAAFDVLTKIIEIVSKTDYLEFLKKEIFEPCQMQDTTFLPGDEQKQRMVEMHTRIDSENSVFEMPDGCIFENFPSAHYLGGAGLVSTLLDYSNFAKMLLNRGQTPCGRILEESTLAMLCTPQVSKEIMPQKERWGLGVRVIAEESTHLIPVGCYGWSGAYGSHFWIDPSLGIAAVFMKNSKIDGGSSNESARNFEKAVYASF